MAQIKKATSLKYAQRIQKSSAEKDAEQKSWKVEDAKYKFEQDLKETRRALTLKLKEIENYKDSEDIEPKTLTALKVEASRLKSGVASLEEDIAELF